MTQETIVAAFDTPAQAQAAARDVEAAGIPASDISQHAGASQGEATGASQGQNALGAGLMGGTTERKEPGFWAKLFGTDDQVDYANDTTAARDHGVYDRTLTGGGSVLSVRIADAERDGDRILNIIENHNPIDIEERAASYSSTGAAGDFAVVGAGSGRANMGTSSRPEDGKIELAEEALVVGKRLASSGTTRIRRYVVETPVSEDVSLHRETVSVERRPVTGGAVAADAFTDKIVEATEMNEEAVVGKTARVVEEVVIRKDASDRVETVHDTVRREQVEIEKVDGTGVVTPKV